MATPFDSIINEIGRRFPAQNTHVIVDAALQAKGYKQRK